MHIRVYTQPTLLFGERNGETMYYASVYRFQREEMVDFQLRFRDFLGWGGGGAGFATSVVYIFLVLMFSFFLFISFK